MTNEASLAVALWGREHTDFGPEEVENKTDEQLEEYERYAITGMAEMLPLWYKEAGLGGILQSMVQLMQILDETAASVSNDDEDMRKARFEVAKQLRMTALLSRKEVQEAVAEVQN